MPPPTQNGYNSRHSAGDVHDGPTTISYQMHRSFSMDSALNNPDPVHINGYDNIIYEVESETEAQEFLLAKNEPSDMGSSARSRVAPRRKTQPRKVAASKAIKNGGAPRGRRAIRQPSVDVDIENDDDD